MKGAMENKGQLNIYSFGTIAIALVFAAVVLGLGGTIMDKIQGTQTDHTATISDNESFAWLGNNTEQGFVQTRIVESSVVVWCNVTLLDVNGNYTVSPSGVSIVNITGLETWDACNYNMTYDYNYGSEAYNNSGYGLTGIVTTAEFIPTVAIIAAAAIIIGIILVFFGRRRY